MKFVVLLALVGLASCRTALLGGDRARDVTIEYTYLDDHGREVTVEVKADKLGLDLSGDDGKLSLKKASPTSATSVSKPRFVQVERKQEPAVRRFMQVHPQPALAPAPSVGIRSRTASTVPVISRSESPSFRFVDLDDFETPDSRFVHVEAPKHKTEARFISVEAPRPKVETRFVQVEIPRPEINPQFVRFEAPEHEVETKFVHVEAPRPKVQTRFVEVDVPEPEFETRFVQVQAPQEVRFVEAKPSTSPRSSQSAHFVVPSSFPVARSTTSFSTQSHVPVAVSSGHRSVSETRHHRFSSDDNSSEK